MNGRVQRRLENEVQKARDAGFPTDLLEERGPRDETFLKATVSVRGVGTISVQYPLDYPFRPPKIRVNHREYDHFLRISSPRFLRLYDQLFSGRCSCACHSSILSTDKWSPAYMLTDIIKDLCRLHHDKCFVAYTLFVDSIKERYHLPEDVDILSFL